MKASMQSAVASTLLDECEVFAPVSHLCSLIRFIVCSLNSSYNEGVLILLLKHPHLMRCVNNSFSSNGKNEKAKGFSAFLWGSQKSLIRVRRMLLSTC